tara:strand:+ start:103 stop:450 length:348 start_codon:yes stop_codon:yes gene_type:complete
MKYEIILVENYPCESKKELELREGWYIRENPCVNHVIPGRTMKEWREDNRESIYVKQKKYHKDNLENILVYQREYRENHREQANYNAKRYNIWVHSFGDPRYTNCVQRCDPSLFH